VSVGPSALWAALTVVAALGFLAWAIHTRGLLARRLLLTTAVLGLLPALLVALAWPRWLDLPYVRFEEPWLTLPSALLVEFVALRLLGLSARLPAQRRRWIELWSSAAALLAAYAASGLSLGIPLDRLTIVVAVDRSRSIDLVPGAAARIATELRAAETSMRDTDRIAVVAFGAQAAIEDPPRPRTTLPSAQKAEIARDGTDLGAAIQKALSTVPPDSAARVVLLTDGVATRGDVERAALAATALGVPVDAVVLDQASVPSVRVAAVRLAPNAAQGEALFFKIVTSSTSDTDVEVRIYRDGELVRKGTTHITRGEDVIALREVAETPGLHRYDVELSALDAARDRAAEDNSGSAFVRVRGPSKALVLEAQPELGRAMADALRSAAFETDVKGPEAVPADAAEFGRYDLIVLGNISASDLAASQLAGLAAYVRDGGGGLLLLGGDRALGPGGYGRTPIEEISPVSFDLKQERRRATLAEIIAVDYSGSMSMQVGERTKLDLANEAAARSAELLGSGDRLGVVHVDTELAWTVPLGPVTDKAEIAARIRKVTPGGGGIYIDRTLIGAYDALGRENVQLKHLLLFSDGADAEERTQAFGLVTRAKRNGITTSVVALGSGSDVPALARMAELGGGRFYLIHDATRLPAVFAQETILASQSAIHEIDFVPVAASKSAVLRGVDFARAPELTGYVVTLLKARAELHLRGPEGDPILATWSAGLGRTGVFTSDYRDLWGARWTSWEGAARLFAQLGRELARRNADPRARLDADASGGELALSATLLDERGRHEGFRRLRVRVIGPDGAARDTELEAVGAGSYRAKLPLNRPGAYLATLVDEEQRQALATTGAVLSPGEELRPTGSDRALLRRIAELTSGKLRENLAGIFDDREARRFGYSPLSAWLAAFAAAALLISVASRRLILPSFAFPRRAKPPEADAPLDPEPVPVEGTLAALKRRKKQPPRASTTPPAPGPATATAAPPAPAAAPAAPAPSPPIARKPAPPRDPGSPKPKSAAEILLERRRARGPAGRGS
jgi:Mg-chelatase subunit ChlD